jgi:hypothetical protein
MYATVATDMYFSSQYVITKACLTHAHSLLSAWPVSNIQTWSQKLTHKPTPSLNTHSHVGLLWHFTMTALTHKCRFLLPCWLICTSFASSSLLWMNELCNKNYLFFHTSTTKSLSCTDYEIITKTIIPPGNIVATPVTHTVNVYNYECGVFFNTSS